MPTITADRLITLLQQIVDTTGQPVDLLLIGALELQCYGFRDRLTNDVAAQSPSTFLLQMPSQVELIIPTRGR